MLPVVLEVRESPLQEVVARVDDGVSFVVERGDPEQEVCGTDHVLLLRHVTALHPTLPLVPRLPRLFDRTRPTPVRDPLSGHEFVNQVERGETRVPLKPR